MLRSSAPEPDLTCPFDHLYENTDRHSHRAQDLQMTYRRKTVDPVTDNNALTDTDLAAVVEALTGESFDYAESDSKHRAPRRDTRR